MDCPLNLIYAMHNIHMTPCREAITTVAKKLAHNLTAHRPGQQRADHQQDMQSKKQSARPPSAHLQGDCLGGRQDAGAQLRAAQAVRQHRAGRQALQAGQRAAEAHASGVCAPLAVLVPACLRHAG
jgi:hypothetical protein